MYTTSSLTNITPVHHATNTAPLTHTATYAMQDARQTHWQAMMRALALKARQPKWITVINPPRTFTAKHLQQWGIHPDQVRVIRSRNGYDDCALVEGAVKANTSCAVLAFSPQAEKITHYETGTQWVAFVNPAVLHCH
ncbi:hypothetical protein BZJ17_00555 [Salinivibrio sp. IB574]|uniref:hypothetical protein n=1 Tax=Salinivibrio sp. IB574 TaxID=1909444 RepID=UPI000988989A|nr:hypothetical protein [Salinivibrio sp. IB574]OOF24653.1 hypothetical protein BZJ17_00555 [Salinivibrio sp. IB574]